MINTKTLLTAAALAVTMAAGAGAANAAPWDDHGRHDMQHRIVDRGRIFETLRVHHYRGLGDPVFMRGHYVVKVMGHFGRPVFVEVDPYTGAFIGEFRI
jgi:hypothetical protein